MISAAHKLSDAFGFLLPGEVDALRSLAFLTPADAVMVNIGAGAGTSSLAIAEVRPNAKRYTVDISPGGPIGGMQNEINAFEKVDNISLPIQILGDSRAVGTEWGNGEIDFLFVDGDHSIDGIRGDIASWLPNMKDGSIMSFHDYEHMKWRDVAKAVDELMEGQELLLHIKTVIAFRIHKLD